MPVEFLGKALLAEAGQQASTIQHALGHQDIGQTMGYVHAGDQAAREAVEQLASQVVLAGRSGVA